LCAGKLVQASVQAEARQKPSSPLGQHYVVSLFSARRLAIEQMRSAYSQLVHGCPWVASDSVGLTWPLELVYNSNLEQFYEMDLL